MNKGRMIVIVFVLGLSLLPVYSFAQTAQSETCFKSNVGLNFADKNSLLSFSGDCKPEMLAQYINALVLYFMRLAIILAVLMLVIGGFQWLLGMGNAEKIGNAKQTIIGALLGLFLALGSTFIFSQIDKSFTILSLPGIKNVNINMNCPDIKNQALCATNFQCRWICGMPLKDGVCPKEDGPPKGRCEPRSLDATCEDFKTDSLTCKSSPGCDMTPTGCHSMYNNASCGIPDSEAQTYYLSERQYTDVNCCESKDNQGKTVYKWARLLYGVGVTCEQVCRGSVKHMATQEEVMDCQNRILK